MMVRHVISIVILLCSFLVAVSAAHAERRLALLIGINEYEFIPRLEKAVGDVNAMERKLKGLGFDVTKVINPDRRTLNIALGRFAARLGPDTLAFLHFSGHGVEIDGDNFLLPRDIPKPESGQRDTVKYEAIGLRRLISQLSSTGARARVFVIDACRDNPFEQSGVRSIGSTRGLARVEAPAGNFIMYSAGYRQRALDKLGPQDAEETSVYTRVLLNKLDQPGLPLAKIAREVREEVQVAAQNVGHVQRPAYYDELSAPLVLARSAADAATASAPQPATPSFQTLIPTVPTANEKQIELLYWNEVRNSKDIAALQSYITQYPTGSFAPLARIRIQVLRKAKKRKLAALTAPTTQPQDEQRAIVPVAVPDPAPEPAPEPAPAPQPALQQAPAPAPLDRRSLVIGVQTQLQRLGCNAGRPDGAWGPRSKRALRAYARQRKIRLSSLDPTPELLNEMNEISRRVCVVRVEPTRPKVERKQRTRKRKARVPREELRPKRRVRKQRVRKQRRRKPRGQVRLRVLGDPSLSIGIRRPARKRRICADRERALCEWDH